MSSLALTLDWLSSTQRNTNPNLTPIPMISTSNTLVSLSLLPLILLSLGHCRRPNHLLKLSTPRHTSTDPLLLLNSPRLSTHNAPMLTLLSWRVVTDDQTLLGIQKLHPYLTLLPLLFIPLPLHFFLTIASKPMTLLTSALTSRPTILLVILSCQPPPRFHILLVLLLSHQI
jgi:hypothetical protein